MTQTFQSLDPAHLLVPSLTVLSGGRVVGPLCPRPVRRLHVSSTEWTFCHSYRRPFHSFNQHPQSRTFNLDSFCPSEPFTVRAVVAPSRTSEVAPELDERSPTSTDV